MIISNKPVSVSARFRLAVFTITICLFPMGLVVAQDFDAVQRRLGEAVADGEIDLEHALVMFEALREHAHHEHMHDDHHHDEEHYDEDNHDHGDHEMSDRDMEFKKRKYMQIEREIVEAVEAGEISEEVAEEKLIGLRMKMFGDEPNQDHDHEDAHEDQSRREGIERRFKMAAEKVEKELANGDITEEEAKQRHEALRERFKQWRASMQEGRDGKDGKQSRRKGIERRFKMAAEKVEKELANGDITEEEAKQRQMALRERYEQWQASLKEDRDRDEDDR